MITAGTVVGATALAAVLLLLGSRLLAVFGLFALAATALVEAAGFGRAADVLASFAFFALLLAVLRSCINLPRSSAVTGLGKDASLTNQEQRTRGSSQLP